MIVYYEKEGLNWLLLLTLLKNMSSNTIESRTKCGFRESQAAHQGPTLESPPAATPAVAPSSLQGRADSTCLIWAGEQETTQAR
jgi:hypothetical protein